MRKKLILIIVILFILLFISLSVSLIIKFNFSKGADNTTNLENLQTNAIVEDTTKNLSTNSTIRNILTEEIEETKEVHSTDKNEGKKTSSSKQTSSQKETPAKANNSSKINTSVNNIKNNTTTKKDNSSNSSYTNTDSNLSIVNIPIKKKPKQNTSTEIQTKEEPTTTNKSISKDEYIRNDTMIEKMKSTIENNPSESMLEYGFKVIEDKSIIESTNYFTFTEKRLISKIYYKFGTIKIYAQDHYYGGEYIQTQCFIL